MQHGVEIHILFLTIGATKVWVNLLSINIAGYMNLKFQSQERNRLQLPMGARQCMVHFLARSFGTQGFIGDVKVIPQSLNYVQPCWFLIQTMFAGVAKAGWWLAFCCEPHLQVAIEELVADIPFLFHVTFIDIWKQNRFTVNDPGMMGLG